MYTIEYFDLIINDKSNKCCSISLYPSTGYAFKSERRKLYIVHHGFEMFYVGETSTSIKTRFQRACTSYNFLINNNKSRNGYKGYKWLNINDNPKRNLNVSVVIFNEEFDNNNQRNFIQAIEGEVVFQIRNREGDLGYWPKYQNEIHFFNNEEAKVIAIKILKEIQERILNINK